MIRVETPRDQVNVAKVYEAGQEQIFEYWEEINSEQRQFLLEQIAAIDFQEFNRLIRGLRDANNSQPAPRDPGALGPVSMVPLAVDEASRQALTHATEVGLTSFRAGEVGVFLVAGGQGTRLRFDGPKGLYPVGPITGRTLFHGFADQILAMQRRVRRSIPWLIMTSRSNHEATRSYFQEHAYFGLNPSSVSFHEQGMLPVVDRRRGRMLLRDRHEIALSPNGHGGAASIIRTLEPTLTQQGIRYLLYHQVDNPLLRVCDPAFLGHHILEDSQFSSKAVAKKSPEEKMGVFCRSGDRTVVVEYTELSDSERHARDADGQLTFRAGNVASHVISVNFLAANREGAASFDMPYHHAYKATPYLRAGQSVDTGEPNSVKFESFLFDVLPHARNPIVVEADRGEEFAPVKGLEGDDTPSSCRQALIDRWARWLESAGVAVPRDGSGQVTATLEVSALFADSAEELADRLRSQRGQGKTIEVTDQLLLE
ncbi:MAG: UTP--glucose-1-phosphate uridylyltransferase [Planctomycetota bacterium]